MTILGIDLGGTKLASAVFDEGGEILHSETVPLEGRSGKAVGSLITATITRAMSSNTFPSPSSIGISVPGIYHIDTGRVWAPNIPDWEEYPLLEEVNQSVGRIKIVIDSDRACTILGECWQGNAKGNKDVIFIGVGTGIGAGILTNGQLVRGTGDIAGAIGWMALKPPFEEEYAACGCFEEYASGEGIAKAAKNILQKEPVYTGPLQSIPFSAISTHDVFEAYLQNDVIAKRVIQNSVIFWGMAAANLISIFNPEKIIWGGGVFGPAISLIPEIKEEASKWAQPISMKQVQFCESGIGHQAAVFGAAYLALKNFSQ